jgi:putative CocE/NonD family hydrolase
VRVVTAFPRPIREIEHCWIPLRDGRRLAARLWLPADAAGAPVPAILEYIPYRKRDLTRTRDEPMHRYFAGHGYAAVRVDVCGAGDSDGVLLDEYHEQELEDGVAVIQWLAAQPWCTGAVGMMGKSWGGFNALQIAARRPDALRAIVTVCSSDDRYADDAHYMGGCLLNENLTWGSVLLTLSALPPDPAVVGDGWRETWLARLRSEVLFPEVWLRHQRRDAYWRRGSVCEDYARITCPVYAIGGWADAYTNAVPRLLAGLRSTRKGLVGPWSHNYPHDGAPGPAIGFLQEARRWWDHWLKGIDTGIMDEPAYRVWMQESAPPSSWYAERSGRWVAEPSWPSPRITTTRYPLNPGRLGGSCTPESRLEWRSRETVGLAAGEWCSDGAEGEAPGDQREDDAGSLTFDSEPLAERLEILGAPVVGLELTVDRPMALVATRLSEVFPDGSSARVTYGCLNLTHRSGHEHPEPLEPGRRYAVRLRLRDVAHVFAPGHRVRLALSTSYWPIVWPSPEVVTLGVFTGSSHLELPVRPPSAADGRLRPFEEPESAPPPSYTELEPARSQRTVDRDAATGDVICTIVSEGGGFGAEGRGRLEALGLEIGHTMVRRYRSRANDPLAAQSEVTQEMTLRRGAWMVKVATQARLAATRSTFDVEATLDAFEGETVVASRRWVRSVPRRGV